MNEGELQELGEVSKLLEDANRVEMRARGLPVSEDLRRDLEEVLRRHGGSLESFGHPTTTMEDLFLRIVEESKAHPGRRYLPAVERPKSVPETTDGESASRAKERSSAIKESKPV